MHNFEGEKNNVDDNDEQLHVVAVGLSSRIFVFLSFCLAQILQCSVIYESLAQSVFLSESKQMAHTLTQHTHFI